jgi:hypothetical protein
LRYGAHFGEICRLGPNLVRIAAPGNVLKKSLLLARCAAREAGGTRSVRADSIHIAQLAQLRPFSGAPF